MGLLKALDQWWTGPTSVKPDYSAPVPEQKQIALKPDDYREPFVMQTMLIHGPGANDFQRVGGDNNSVVFSCLLALSTAYTEPPLSVHRVIDPRNHEELLDHPLQALLESPNPVMDLAEILWWCQWAKHSDGNAYIRKDRAGGLTTGNVVELWPVSPLLMKPVTYKSSNDFISAYRFEYEPGKYEDVAPENIIHLKLGIDDLDHRRGLSTIKRLIRLISSDDEAAIFANALLGNFAVPGLVITPHKDADPMSPDEATDMKNRISATFGSRNRGNVGILAGGATAQQFGFSPEQLNLTALHQIPETRICSTMRVPPAIVGVSVGLEQTSNYASMREVREMFTEQTLLPEWSMDARKFTKALVREFTPDNKIALLFNVNYVRALQEDVNKKMERLNQAVLAGWITPDEARAAIGYDPMEEPVQPAARRAPRQLDLAS